MAETLLSFGVDKLWNLLVRESERFQGVKEQFDELKRDLDMLRCFLEDADAKKHTSAMVRNTLKEVKEIVYDAEDIIETFLLNEELGKTSGNMNAVRRIFKRRGLAFDVKAISKRISDVIRDMQTLGVQKVIVKERDTQSLEERQRQMRKTFPTVNEDHLVGLEENVKRLVGYLVEEDNIQVVSIAGMGGIGKTTLARQVFHHEMVKNHFDGVVWVCVSQQFERTYVWKTILKKLSSNQDEQVSNMSEDELQDKLFRLLETSNSLIVLDDIWKEADWDIIKPAFPSKKGWKILLTSRNENVAFHADPTCVTFKPECLSADESWKLFRPIAFPRKDTTTFNVEMEEMGKEMINNCGGLPLAVKVLGGLLAEKHSLSDWKRISENIKSHIVGGTSFNAKNMSSVYQILYLSFEELPIYLKQCFLYFAHFPEDYSIRIWDLAYYWAAEGIPRPKYYDGATIEEIADGYIEELVKRNMVISKREVKSSRFKTCQLHDVMREVCLLKAEEENFVQIVEITASTMTSQSPCKSRRIAVHGDLWEGEIQNPKLRSLLFIAASKGMASSMWFTRLQLMRILDLSFTEFKGGKLPSSIGKLIHLRYLSLFGANVSHLPSSMRNLRQLLYLNLRVHSKSPIYIPNILKELRELAYLNLALEMHDKTKLELGNLINLETLKNFSTKHSNVKDLQRMKRLQTLSILFKGDRCTMKTLSSSVSEMRHLENLTIDEKGVDAPKNDEEGFVLDCVHLKQLDLTIYMPKLRDEQHFPCHLTTISLKYCRLVEDPMPILEKLVQLTEFELGSESFSGMRMVCSGGGFPRLHTLRMETLKEWEEWIVEQGSMPLLHTLGINKCPKLKQFAVGRFPQLHTLELTSLVEWEEWRVEEGSMPLLRTLMIWNCPKLKQYPAGGFPKLQELSISRLYEWEEWIVEEGSMPLLQSLTIRDCQELKKFPAVRFPQLHRLAIWELYEVEEWIVEEGSMPLLHTLSISDCPKLKELPDGLLFIYSLKNLKMDKEWKERLSQGGEDYYKVKHIPSIEFHEMKLSEIKNNV